MAPGFDALDVPGVPIDALGELLLGEVGLSACCGDVLAKTEEKLVAGTGLNGHPNGVVDFSFLDHGIIVPCISVEPWKRR